MNTPITQNYFTYISFHHVLHSRQMYLIVLSPCIHNILLYTIIRSENMNQEIELQKLKSLKYFTLCNFYLSVCKVYITFAHDNFKT